VTLRSHGSTVGLAAFALLVVASASADPEDALLEIRDLAAGWEVVREATVDPRRDEDLREWGVHSQHARHYTRDLRGRVQVCSVEFWGFDSVSQASAAHEGFYYPDWQIFRAGKVLVMVRGLVRGRDGRPHRGVFADCDAIGSRILERASAL
jgi:hypothetical protein